jgi:hypothetical protein
VNLWQNLAGEQLLRTINTMPTDRVIVVPYDPDWPRRFEHVRAVLAAVSRG